jgi:hypothetical protein
MRNLPIIAAVIAAGLIPLPAAAQSTEEVSCTVGEVAVFADRVHVFCSGGAGQTSLILPGTIRYFSVEISDPLALPLITIASAATVHGRPIAVTANTVASANPAGCLPGDCRRLVAVKGFGG